MRATAGGFEVGNLLLSGFWSLDAGFGRLNKIKMNLCHLDHTNDTIPWRAIDQVDGTRIRLAVALLVLQLRIHYDCYPYQLPCISF